jgi:hypothetical protein
LVGHFHSFHIFASLYCLQLGFKKPKEDVFL